MIILFLSPILQAENLSPDRRAFVAALSDLQRGKETEFKVITAHLNHYCLYPYLVYADLAIHLPAISRSHDTDIRTFLKDYSETPLAPHLLKLWLYQLAENRDWKNFLEVYPIGNKDIKNDLNLGCYQREALWQTGAHDQALNDLPGLLSKTNTIPKSCMGILAQAFTSGEMIQKLLWEKIQSALEENNLGLAIQLAAFLPDNQKMIFNQFKAVNQNPLLILHPEIFVNSQPLQDKILLLAIRKISVKNPRFAAAIFTQVQKQMHFGIDTQSKVIAIIALALAQNHDPNATAWLAAVRDNDVDQNIRQWRIRNALWQQNWGAVATFINLLPVMEKQSTQWRYWYARALDKLGQFETAKNIFQDLSVHGDFYGQLASLQLNQEPLSALKEMKVSMAQINAIASLPAIQRAHELYELHWMPESIQEWQWALSHMPEEDYLAAAELAIHWGWFERAIDTVNLINDSTNIGLKFPLAYHAQIINASAKNQINPAVLFALIRQESLFTPYARSHAGAIGLMQLMPGTANLIANQLHRGLRIENLLDPDINLFLGGIYFKKLSLEFNRNEVLTVAAYNAGPNRVKKWLPSNVMPADIWIENIPYRETRNYVKNILTSTTFYEKELGLPVGLASRVEKI